MPFRLHDIIGTTFDNQDIMSLTEKELIELRRSKMGMVFQSSGCFTELIRKCCISLEMRTDKYTRRAGFRSYKVVGLEGREEYFPRELSGGQQHVGIARVLAIEPIFGS